MAAGLKTAIFAVARLGVDDLAAVFTLDSAHTGVAINEIFHQGILTFAFPLFCCHKVIPRIPAFGRTLFIVFIIDTPLSEDGEKNFLKQFRFPYGEMQCNRT